MKVYIALMFLLHGLSPAPGLAFSFMLGSLALLFALAAGRLPLRSTRFRLDDGIFGALFVLGLIPLVFAPGRLGLQNVLYAGLWFAIWMVCFWWVREWVLASQITFLEMSKAAAIGAMLLAVSVIVEFWLANTTGQYLSDLVPFSIKDFPMANVLGDEFRRPRGFTAEAGFSAIVFECLVPLSLAWLKQGSWRRWLFAALVLPAYLVLFSAASILLLVVVLLVYLGFARSWERAVLIGLVIAALVGAVALTSDEASWLLYEVVARKLLEFSPDDLAGGAETFSRPEAYALALSIMTERPWGIGWGGVSQAMTDRLALFGTDLRGSGLISIPLEIGASAGVLALVGWIAIVWRKLARLVHIDSLAARLTFVSLAWVALHHAVVLEFWFPMIWFSLALADVVVARAAGQEQPGWRYGISRRAQRNPPKPRLGPT